MTIEVDEQLRLKEELVLLRQTIIRVEPSVMLDGRFEEMITTPRSVLTVARELIGQIPALKKAEVWV